MKELLKTLVLIPVALGVLALNLLPFIIFAMLIAFFLSLFL